MVELNHKDAFSSYIRETSTEVLKDMKQRDKITCTGRGPAARWEKR